MTPEWRAMEQVSKARNDALCIALEMLAYLMSEWEAGTPCHGATDGVLHTDDYIGNALLLGDEEHSINLLLEKLFPVENLKHINPTTWEDRITALVGDQ